METEKEKCLGLSLDLIGQWLPYSREDLMEYYQDTQDLCSLLEKSGSYRFMYFSWPILDHEGKEMQHPDLDDESILFRFVILVFDENDAAIADCSGFMMTLSDFLASSDVYEKITSEDDWSNLEYYTLESYFFSDLHYPYCLQPDKNKKEISRTYGNGQVCIFTNAYVTKSFRKQGIFSTMLDIQKECQMGMLNGTVSFYTVFSMDPDVAVYGPDASDKPYYYSYQKDEPDRMRNRTIAEKLGYEPVRLEETEKHRDDDGTKLWFALRKETDVIMDEPMMN